MSKHDKLKQEKALRNELYAEKHKKRDKQARKQARRLRVRVREQEAERKFWEGQKKSVGGGVFVPPYDKK